MSFCKISGLLKIAVQQALDGHWDDAHKTVQLYEDDATACWIHAVLHKIEGDVENSKYWYGLAGREYSAVDSKIELQMIMQS